MSAFANRFFESRCEPKQRIPFYYKICPCWRRHTQKYRVPHLPPVHSNPWINQFPACIAKIIPYVATTRHYQPLDHFYPNLKFPIVIPFKEMTKAWFPYNRKESQGVAASRNKNDQVCLRLSAIIWKLVGLAEKWRSKREIESLLMAAQEQAFSHKFHKKTHICLQ